MAVLTKKTPLPALVETVDEIMKIYRSLPPRPSIEEVEAAMSVIKTVNTEEKMRLEEITSKQLVDAPPPQDVPPELFSLLQQVRKTTVLFHSHEQRKEASFLIEADKIFQTFDDLIQSVSDLVSDDDDDDDDGGDGQEVQEEIHQVSDPVEKKGRSVVMISDESLIKKRDVVVQTDGLLLNSSSTKPFLYSGQGDTEKLSLLNVAARIETSAKFEAKVLNLEGKLMDNVEWIPLSIGKLSHAIEINLSQNHIMALPSTICSLRALTKLDIHSNNLINLPDSFEELVNLTHLDLHANRLKSLPASFKNLINMESLDLSSNNFTHLPELIGHLTSLKRLNADTNDLEDLPHTIGSCTSLVEMRLDFNQLRALPEAIGKLECLEILTLHYNRIKGLPTTIGNLANLRELDVSFNELESVPENLCFVLSLKKLNLGKNFADLRALPRSIGNLEMLEELDISGNQIRVLPDSFRSLSKLRAFVADETPLEMPSRQVIEMGAQAVVKYMGDYVAKRDTKFQVVKRKRGFWLWVCSLFRVSTTVKK